MKVDFEFEKPLDEIVADVLRMETIMESEQAELMKNIGKEIQKQVKTILPKSDSTTDGYQTGAYKHMRDDVKVTVNGKKAKTGIIVWAVVLAVCAVLVIVAYTIYMVGLMGLTA